MRLLFKYPCGIHMGPEPIPRSCHICERFIAAERARPPIDNYGREITQARKNQRESGRKNGQANTAKGNDNRRAFPAKRKKMTAAELRAILAGKKAKAEEP